MPLKLSSQILINFHRRLAKIELLITFDRELATSYLLLQEETTDVKILIDDVLMSRIFLIVKPQRVKNKVQVFFSFF